uniref:NF5 n=1 Tax=synthetic construct TaxID=32630 RepID=UPI001AA00CDC|nr:Chain A, NF5 [synthetic construct]
GEDDEILQRAKDILKEDPNRKILIILNPDGKIELYEVTSEEDIKRIAKKAGISEELLRRILQSFRDGQYDLFFIAKTEDDERRARELKERMGKPVEILRGSLEHHHHHH